MRLLATLLRCRLLGHAARHIRGTFFVSCDRCGAFGRIA